MKLSALRYLLLWDAVILFLLGGLLVFMPGQVLKAFHFKDLPPAVSYMLGLWGCGIGTLGIGYLVAARDPLRHLIWVQLGIARGFLECLVGIVYVTRGVATFQQAGIGITLAALIAVAYIILYPRKPGTGGITAA
jgi:hypothetical protein